MRTAQSMTSVLRVPAERTANDFTVITRSASAPVYRHHAQVVDLDWTDFETFGIAQYMSSITSWVIIPCLSEMAHGHSIAEIRSPVSGLKPL